MISRFMENVKQTVIIKLQIIERGLNRVGASYRGGLTSNFRLIRGLNIERGLKGEGGLIEFLRYTITKDQLNDCAFL